MLRIIAGSDFHYPRRVKTLDAVRAMAAQPADVLVLAGDMVDHFHPVALLELLQAAAAFEGPRLYVWGNHELWSRHTAARKIHQDVLPALAHEAGFHVPEVDGPLYVGPVAFVGAMGWYDYAYALDGHDVAAEVVDLGVEPGRLALRRSGRTLADLTADDYATHELSWYEGGRVRAATWSDRQNAQWDVGDDDLVAESVDCLRGQLSEAAERADTIVAITHMVPHAAGLHDGDSVWRSWIKAYMGSPRLGEALDEERKVAHGIFGHCHRGRSFERPGWRGHNVASPVGRATMIEVTP